MTTSFALRLGLALALVVGACSGRDSEPAAAALPPCPDPNLLACSGLYGEHGESWATRAIAPDVLAYEPGLQFWSDGLTKTRYLRLPPGTRIDTTDPDGWIFPIGTSFWKELSWQGRRIETRLMQKVTDQAWYFMAFAWNADGSDAIAVRDGQRNVPGTEGDAYEIPSARDCFTCHGGRPDKVLGFETLALSLPAARGLRLEELAARGLVTTPLAPLAIPGDATAQAALGSLHVNCGVACHNPTPGALASWTGMYLRLDHDALDSVDHTRTFLTTVGVPSAYEPPAPGPFFRIAPGDIAHSAIAYRDAQRGTPAQMPPLATHRVDRDGLAQVEAWIESLRPAPHDAGP